MTFPILRTKLVNMDKEVILKKISNLRTWSRGDQRAVHKPLLVLYSLGQLQAGNKKLLYQDIDEPLKELLKYFGPSSNHYRPHYPFWRLQNDDIWELLNTDKVTANNTDDVSVTELIEYKVSGGFKPEILKLFKNNPKLLLKVARELLTAHFPETWHEEIIDAVGLSSIHNQNDLIKRKRDPDFRRRILIAYQYTCAVCRTSLKIGNQWPTLEAAHIKWHQANGPDIESNGIALCCTHHKLFDRGAFTLDDKNKLIVSEELHGEGLSEIILKYHGKSISKTVRKSYMPELDFKNWHRNQVFRGNAREF